MVSQQPTAPQRQVAPAGFDRDVADLAAVAGRAGHRPAIDDQPAADADLARDVQHVVIADGGPAAVLGQSPEVRLVGDRDRDAHVERPIEPFAERDIAPAEVRGHRDEPVAPADDTDHGHADADESLVIRAPPADGGGQGDETGHDFLDRRVAAGSVDPDLLEDAAAEPDDRDGQRVDLDIDGQDHGAVRLDLDHR